MVQAKPLGTLDCVGEIITHHWLEVGWSILREPPMGLRHRGTSASIKQNLGLLSMFYDGTNFTVKIDGTVNGKHVLHLVPCNPFPPPRYAWDKVTI